MILFLGALYNFGYGIRVAIRSWARVLADPFFSAGDGTLFQFPSLGLFPAFSDILVAGEN